MSKTVFFTGATGYIGGATLALLLSTPATKSYKYSVLVRNKEKAARLEAFGVRPVIASLSDASVLAAEAEKADIVVHTADSSDNLQASQAILAGLRKRNDNPILIHVSGTAVVMDDARGEYTSDKVYSDLDASRINSLPDDAPHRNVDLNVINAAPQVRTHIVLPPTIYGIANHALVKAGVSNSTSIQVPSLIHAGVDRGQAGVVGKGLNIWPNVHIDDIAAVIVMVLEAAVAGKTVTGREGYYFGETGEHKLHDVCAEIARALSAHGIGTPEPTPFTAAEIQKYYGGSYFMGSNSRVKAERTRRLGWSSTRTTADFIASITPEVEYYLKTKGARKTA